MRKCLGTVGESVGPDLNSFPLQVSCAVPRETQGTIKGSFELLSHWDKKRAYLEESIDSAVKISSIRDNRPAVIEMHPDSINL